MWRVQLTGDTSDLAALAQSLTGNTVKIFQDGQHFVFESDEFGENEKAEEVWLKAKRIVSILSGAARLVLDARQAITVPAVYRVREDGSRDAYVFPEGVVTRVRAPSASVTITHPDGTMENLYPADIVKEWPGIALRNDSVAKVFEILGTGVLDWVNLYRIYEIVGADLGNCNLIKAKGWASKAALKSFKHTANCPKTIGLESRHGAPKHQPPTKPMSISEARTLWKFIVHAWLQAKVGKHQV